MTLQLLIMESMPSTEFMWDLDRRTRINLNIAVTYHAILVLSFRKKYFELLTDSSDESCTPDCTAYVG